MGVSLRTSPDNSKPLDLQGVSPEKQDEGPMKIRKTLTRLVLLFILLGGIGLAIGGDIFFPIALKRFGPTAIGQQVNFQEARLSLLGGSAEVDQLHIGNPDRPLIELGQMLFDAGIRDLLSGRILIEIASLTNGQLRLEIDKNGRFTFDPGPPPSGTEVTEPQPEDEQAGEPTPEADYDLAQIIAELWDRYQEYEGYYDEYGGIFSGSDEAGGDSSSGGDKQTGADPKSGDGGTTQEDADGLFWLAKAEIADFRWTTIDHRNGNPILPPIERGTLTLLDIGQADAARAAELKVGPATVRADLELSGGGVFRFDLQMPREARANSLLVELRDLPVEALGMSLGSSLPFRLSGGFVDVRTEGLTFSDDSLTGTLSLELRDVKVSPRKGAKKVLGIAPKDFCRVLTRALKKDQIAFVFGLSGRPTKPKFELEDAPRLEKMVLEALEEEIRERAEAELKKLQDKADAIVGDLEDKADAVVSELEGLEGKAKGAIGDIEGEANKAIGGALGKEAGKKLGDVLGKAKGGKDKEAKKKAEAKVKKGLDKLLDGKKPKVKPKLGDLFGGG
ncbi:MAG: hypothetical protein ACI841_001340 [Planctomycetota bacterium]